MSAMAMLWLGPLIGGLLLGCMREEATMGSGGLQSGLQPGLENGSFTADLNGFAIHYEVHGQGPVLMTLPNSWGLELDGLRALYRPLEERLTMVYFDPRGMGLSGEVRQESDMSLAAVREDFDALRQHLGLQRVDAIGWSNGATNLIWLASERPEILDSAIFLHGAASYSEEDAKAFAARYPELVAEWTAFMQEMAEPGLSDEERTTRMKDFWIERYFARAVAKPEVTVGQLIDLYRDVDFSWAHAMYAQQESWSFDLRDRLPDIEVRSLVVLGTFDLLPVDQAKVLADGLPEAQLAVLEESGHFSPVEQPERFREVVLEFLDE